MFTILEQSVSKQKLKSFRTLKWRSSNKPKNESSETFWVVRTQFRRQKFLQYLQMKRLLDLCSDFELRCLYDVPGVLEDNLYLDALRAWKTDVPKDILWQRLQVIQRFLQRPEWSPNLFYTYDGTICYEMMETLRPIRKVKKYSGYVRNSSSVGSKRNSRLSLHEPESFEWNSNVEIDYYSFLTVGEFFSGQPGNVFFTLMKDRKSETVPNKKSKDD